MNSLENFQTNFLNAIYGAPNPIGIKDGYDKNFDIYRNNLDLGLLENLRNKFPNCEIMLGEEFFKQATLEFIKKHPLESGHNNDFGTYFATFLDDFLFPEIRFVAKIAEIEWAKFCADTAPNIGNADFLSISNAIAAGIIQIELHPSFCMLEAEFNAFELYFAHEKQDLDEVSLKETNQTVAIWRDKDFDPCLMVLDEFETTFMREILANKSIIEAIEKAIETHGQTEENQSKFVNLCNSGVFKTP